MRIAPSDGLVKAFETREESVQSEIDPGGIRLSIGLEASADITADLETALSLAIPYRAEARVAAGLMADVSFLRGMK